MYIYVWYLFIEPTQMKMTSSEKSKQHEKKSQFYKRKTEVVETEKNTEIVTSQENMNSDLVTEESAGFKFNFEPECCGGSGDATEESVALQRTEANVSRDVVRTKYFKMTNSNNDFRFSFDTS